MEGNLHNQKDPLSRAIPTPFKGSVRMAASSCWSFDRLRAVHVKVWRWFQKNSQHPESGPRGPKQNRVCAFFHNQDEEYEKLLPFIKKGFETKDKASYRRPGVAERAFASAGNSWDRSEVSRGAQAA